MYDIINYGTHDIRSLKEIRLFAGLSAPFIRQESSQGSPNSNYQTSCCLVDRREIPQELPQASPKKTRPQEAINYLTIVKRIRIISLVGGVYGKR